jgi:hypothetical protein
MILLLAAGAHATPFWTALPATTVPSQQTEFGMGGGAAVALEAPGLSRPVGTPMLSSWARWGATDRVEVSGGVWLPLNPFEVGLHGLARVQLLEASDGVGLTLGGGAGLLTRSGLLSVAAPIEMGHSGPKGGFWVGGAPVLYVGAGGSVGAGSFELGGFVMRGRVPVYLVAGTEAGAFLAVSGMLGVGFPADW